MATRSGLTATVNVPIYARLNNKEIELGTLDVPVRFDGLVSAAEEISETMARAFEPCDGQVDASEPDGGWVEIGGQRMTQAQFDAARFPLLADDPGPTADPKVD